MKGSRGIWPTIAGENRGDHLWRRHWLRFIRSVGVAQAPRSGGSRLRQRPLSAVSKPRVPMSRRCRGDARRGRRTSTGDHRAVARQCRSVLDGLRDMQDID